MPPERVAEIVFQAIRENRFYIFTHPESMPLIRLRADDILANRNPSDPMGM
jgi:hypothetical protein